MMKLHEIIKTPRQLYVFLIRSCDKLPKGAKEFYKHSIKQSFKQHLDESDPQRIREIMEKSLSDAEWIFKKYNLNVETLIDKKFNKKQKEDK